MPEISSTQNSPQNLSASELRRLVELEREMWARDCRRHLLPWCIEALEPNNQVPARHHRLLIRELESVASGETDRLMVFMPPGSAKTRYASQLFPPWFMQRGGMDIIGASHGSALAETFSSDVIRLIQRNSRTLGYVLLNESSEFWRTSNGGTYRAAGAGGSITGRRADLFVIDDPIKGREDADSLTIRDKVWNWYRAEVITRLKPGARIILIQTRWHEDDLAGRLLTEMNAGADQWRVLNLPAIAEDDDALGRNPGEALWPEWEDFDQLARKRTAIGEREWAALFQQRPRPAEGSIFKIGMIEILPACPPLVVRGRGWDLAATKNIGTRDPDYTAGIGMGRTAEGKYVIFDCRRERGGPDEVKSLIRQTATLDGQSVRIGFPQDPGQAGKAQVLDYARLLAGHVIDSLPVTGDKATRAAPFASQVNVGNVAIVNAEWNRPLLDELAAFPSGTHDDQVDAASEAFRLVGLGPTPIVFSPGQLRSLRAQAMGARR